MNDLAPSPVLMVLNCLNLLFDLRSISLFLVAIIRSGDRAMGRRAARTGWRGNELGLVRFEVMSCHNTRLDATEAIAHLMRGGKGFHEAKAIIEKRAASVYSYAKPYRPALYEGHMRMVRCVEYGDMPKDIRHKASDDMVADLERLKGRPLSRLSKWSWRTFGVWW